MNINARFPGSVHDSAIWQTSLVRNHLENNFRQNRNELTYLLGKYYKTLSCKLGKYIMYRVIQITF